MSAEVKILVEGYTNADLRAESGGEEKTCPTITLVKDGDLIMVVDPGVLDNQQILIEALKKRGLNLEEVSMVCITHSHLDHYRNLGMFANAKVLEYFGVWSKNTVEDWHEQFSPYIQILRTPGHDDTSITLFIKTENGIVAVCGDVFWKENYPADPFEDIFASDPQKLKESRKIVLKMADWAVPGHGPMFKVEKEKIRELNGKKLSPNNNQKHFAVCRKCKRIIKKKIDSCRCRPWLCYRCCECGLDCELCKCSHIKK